MAWQRSFTQESEHLNTCENNQESRADCSNSTLAHIAPPWHRLRDSSLGPSSCCSHLAQRSRKKNKVGQTHGRMHALCRQTPLIGSTAHASATKGPLLSMSGQHSKPDKAPVVRTLSLTSPCRSSIIHAVAPAMHSYC